MLFIGNTCSAYETDCAINAQTTELIQLGLYRCHWKVGSRALSLNICATFGISQNNCKTFKTLTG